MAPRSILLVEDNADHELLTIRALRRHEMNQDITVVRDGQEALDYLFGAGPYAARDVADAPRVVLLDLNLPKVNGLDVLQRLRADDRTRLLPVVVLSSSDESADIDTSYRLGANSYVRKPVSFSHFVEAVGQLGTYWLRVNEAPYGG